MRYAGIKNGKISILSEQVISNKDLEVLEVPEELEHLSNTDLIVSCRVVDGRLTSKLARKSAKNMKVALVSNIKSECGIGTYSKFLFEALVPLLGDYKIFSEETDRPSIDGLNIPNDKIIDCWKRGESLTRLVSEIKNYNPDVILFQHEFGLFPVARYWISMMNQLHNYKTITTMHSVFRHADKAIVEACMDEIIVHVPGAKKVLEEDKGINKKIHIIPHGCFPCTDLSKPWNFYKTKNNFIQMGFLFHYKAFENCIEATAILKQKYPDVYFTGICSESPHATIEHQMYYNDLMDLIKKLDLQENVGLIRGFQSEKILDVFLRMNRAAVFPYKTQEQHECWGASGSGPYTMAKGIPVISSNVHHFKDLPTIKAESPQKIAERLDELFSDWKLIKSQVEKQNKYLLENSWEITAQRYIETFENT